MPLGKRQRKIILVLGLALGGLVLLCVSLPLWFPWMLGGLTRHWGAEYSAYERLGYNRFVVRNVVFTNQDVRVQVRKMEAFLPPAWLWRLQSTNRATAYVTVDGWEVEPKKRTAKHGGSSVHGTVEDVAVALKPIQQWLPAASLSNGTVRLPDGAVRIPAATWTGTDLQAQVIFSNHLFESSASVTASVKGAGPYVFRIHSQPLNLQSILTLSKDKDSVTLRSTHVWRSNQIDLEAHFARRGALPETAHLDARQLRIPADLAGIRGYGDLNGSISADWKGGEFAIDLDAQATATQTNLPQVKATIHAQGDTNSLIVKTATLSTPFLEAKLSRDLHVYFTGPFVREPATAQIAADLSRQPWFSWKGMLTGQAEIQPQQAPFPLVGFRISGTDVELPVVPHGSLVAKTVQLDGKLDWPSLTVSNASAVLEEGCTVQVHGKLNLEKKMLGDGAIQLNCPAAPPWLPCKALQLTGSAHGPLTNLVHEGRLDVSDYTTPHFKPLQLQLAWQGELLNLGNVELQASAGSSSLSTRAALSVDHTGIDMRLKELTLRQNESETFRLAAESRISAGTGQAGKWRLAIDSFHCAGKGGDISARGDVSWPDTGRAEAAIHEVRSDVFQDFFMERIESFEIRTMNCQANWTNGPATFDLGLSATGFGETNLPLSVEAQIRGDSKGIVISNLVVSSQTNSVAEARGKLPVSVIPGREFIPLQFDPGAPLQLAVTTRPEAIFWNKLSALAGINLREPNCTINLAGTWAAPQGEVLLSAKQIQLRNATAEMPRFENLAIQVLLDREQAQITNAHVEVQGQPVMLTAEMPLGQDFWKSLNQKRVPNWDKATARLRIDQAEVAAFSLLLPKVLSPQGTLSADLSLKAGGNLEGAIELEKGRTRPLGNLGPIRDINTTMKFAGRKMAFEKATANIGGSVVNLAGDVDLRGTNWISGEIPPFAIKVLGTNVPLSRQPDAIIRSDLNLAVTRTNSAPALISGTIVLRNSFFLRDLRDLIPGSVSAPTRRPPYFSIDIPPLSDWRLATRVTGTRFVKIRSTLFDGEVSANLRLEGTLKEPVALGDIKIDSGLVRFPFATLDVRQGFVTLSSENPYRPQLTVSAGSKKFGYDVKMDASGYADAPILQFSSIPPLSSEQLVLMLTAGEMPRGTVNLTPSQKAQTVAVFFGRDFLARFGIGDESEDRLTFSSGQEVSEQGKPTYNVEYKLDKRWSLVGEYDRFNAFNAGLKWRVYSK